MRRVKRPALPSRAALTLGAVAALLCASTAPQSWAAGDPSPKDLKAVERALQREREERERLDAQAKTTEQELSDLSEQLVAAAKRVQDHEETLSNLEDQLGGLRKRDTALRDALARRDDQVVRVLTAIQRLAWRPTEALLVQPVSPADTVRGAILLRSAIPQIEENAREIVSQIKTLRDLDTAMRAQRAQIRATNDSLRAEHAQLRDLVEEKRSMVRDLRAQGEAATARMEKLTRDAKDLRDLMARLEEEKLKRETEERQRLQQREAERLAALAIRPKPEEPEETALPNEPPLRIPPASPPNRPNGSETASVAASPNAPSPPPADQTAATGRPAPSNRPVENMAETASRPPDVQLSAAAFEGARGAMPFPARGRLSARYGERTDLGDTLKGMRIQTRAGGQVVSPHNGVVVFAGPFRGYGNLLIIDHGGGYHTLLAGLGRIDAIVGQRLAAGEPVGLMPPMGSKNDDSPSLYVELRRDGQPINPLPWLTASKGNASG
ncbi:murein hydrolase activator EnvC family protein [Rhodospirillum sp. A1_3_36]|uniref:murein hydrolase activator EnvC family protein n=1 Tax=Rhodospirillum sp. A1_3_36 TaxID=3391666 RepID=UPI0039A77768